jgi:CubicO group peptidase (beta-lactamase class C family)
MSRAGPQDTPADDALSKRRRSFADGACTSGHVAPGFEGVADEFARNFAEREELGAAFAAVQNGELVVDLLSGIADRQESTAWYTDTMQSIFSGTKGLVS